MTMIIDDCTLAKYCDEAYRKATHVHDDAGIEAMVRVRMRPKAFVVAFRGTEDVEDAVRDAQATPWWAQGIGFCHRGFLGNVKKIWPLLSGDVLGAYRADLPVILTGHSKGAAEATLFAAFMCRIGAPPHGLVTFGSPRVGFQGLSDLIEGRGVNVRRFVNGLDPVTRVPLPGQFIWRYRHVGDQITLPGTDGQFDHSIKAYIKELKAGR